MANYGEDEDESDDYQPNVRKKAVNTRKGRSREPAFEPVGLPDDSAESEDERSMVVVAE